MGSNTLILLADHIVARVDVNVRDTVTIESLITIDRPERSSLADLIQSAISLSSKPCQKVWFFSQDFWTGVITIPSDLHGIVNADELAQSILLEAELHSEISAFNSKVALKRLIADNHNDPQYWVIQITDHDFETIDRTLTASKVTWVGITQPDFTCRSASIEKTEEYIDSLKDESSIREWAIDTANRLSSITSERPCFLAAPRKLSEVRQTQLATVLCVITIVACIGIYLKDLNTLRHYESTTKSLIKQKAEDEKLARDIAKIEENIKENRKRLQDRQQHLISLTKTYEKSQMNRARRASHCTNLISAISEVSDDDLWLRKIESKNGYSSIGGISLKEESAHQFAQRLELHPNLVEFEVGPAETKTLDNGLVDFTISIDCHDSDFKESNGTQTLQWDAVK